jgi:putative ABC transport system permease protein
MFKNYLKIAFRNLLKNKTLSAVNIIGLSVGIACTLLITLHVKKELAYDRGFSKAERIFRITNQGTGDDTRHWAATAPTVAPAMENQLPEVESGVRFYRPYPYMLFSYTQPNGLEKKFEETGSLFADAGVISMFDLQFVKGDPKTALDETDAVVLTEEMAAKYFGTEDPLGKTIQDNKAKFPLKVTGVIKAFSFPTHLDFSCLLSMKTIRRYLDKRSLANRTWSGMYNYVLLKEGRSKKDVEAKMDEFMVSYYAENGKTRQDILSAHIFKLQPLTDIHLGWKLEKEMSANSDSTYVYIFSIAALLILLIAAVNFINISTSQAFSRMKEIGLRKVIGATKRQLIKQFLGESLLVTLLSTVLALLLFRTAMPFYEKISGGGSGFINMITFSSAGLLLLLVLFVGLLAGLYPAWFVAKFNPVSSLKGTKMPVSSVNLVRKGLVVFQFVVSVFLIFSTVIIYRQMKLFHNKDLGFDKEQVMAVTMYEDMWKNYRVLTANIRKNPAISGYGTASRLPGERLGSYSFNVLSAKENTTDDGHIREMSSDDKFLTTMHMQLVAGRNFENQFPEIKKKEFILNEAAVKTYGIKDPVGKQVVVDVDTGTVIGVVKDFNFASLHAQVEPLAIQYNPFNSSYLLLKIKENSVPETIAFMQSQVKELSPSSNFSYSFINERLDKLYTSENKMSQVFKVFAALAIFISCLGLFGLSVYTTRMRVKEVGIRKVLGASVPTLAVLLSKDFLKLVLVAVGISLPIAWWFMNQWLNGFAYRVDVNVWVFVVSGFLALLMAAFTVGFQTIRAASVKPVKSLGAE